MPFWCTGNVTKSSDRALGRVHQAPLLARFPRRLHDSIFSTPTDQRALQHGAIATAMQWRRDASSHCCHSFSSGIVHECKIMHESSYRPNARTGPSDPTLFCYKRRDKKTRRVQLGTTSGREREREREQSVLSVCLSVVQYNVPRSDSDQLIDTDHLLCAS